MEASVKVSQVWSRIRACFGDQGPGLAPVDMIDALKKEARGKKKIFRQGTFVPDTYAVQICGQDYRDLAPFLSAVQEELVEELASWFRKMGFQTTGAALGISFEPRGDLPSGTLRIKSAVAGGRALEEAAHVVLVIRPETVEAKEVQIGEGTHGIGRGKDSSVAVPRPDPLMSNRHFSLEVKEGAVFIRDLSSANGTFLNKEPVLGKRAVQSGDTITAGKTCFKVVF